MNLKSLFYNIRKKINIKLKTNKQNNTENQNIHIHKTSYVTQVSTNETCAEDFTKSLLHDVRKTFNIKLKTNKQNNTENNKKQNNNDTIFISKRHKEPINDITGNEMVFTAVFPIEFILGTAYGQKTGTLNLKQRTYLLKQFKCHIAKNSLLLFYLFNQIQRHSNNFGVKYKLNNDPKLLQKFKALTDPNNKKDFFEKINKVIKYPNGDEAKEILLNVFVMVLDHYLIYILHQNYLNVFEFD